MKHNAGLSDTIITPWLNHVDADFKDYISQFSFVSISRPFLYPQYRALWLEIPSMGPHTWSYEYAWV